MSNHQSPFGPFGGPMPRSRSGYTSCPGCEYPMPLSTTVGEWAHIDCLCGRWTYSPVHGWLDLSRSGWMTARSPAAISKAREGQRRTR